MRLVRLLTALLALWPFLAGMSGDAHATQSADQFMLLLKRHRFDEAAKAFFYPHDFTPLRLEREQAMIAQFLESSFRVAGNIKSQTRNPPQGASDWWALGIGAGKPVSPSDIGAEGS